MQRWLCSSDPNSRGFERPSLPAPHLEFLHVTSMPSLDLRHFSARLVCQELRLLLAPKHKERTQTVSSSVLFLKIQLRLSVLRAGLISSTGICHSSRPVLRRFSSRSKCCSGCSPFSRRRRRGRSSSSSSDSCCLRSSAGNASNTGAAPMLAERDLKSSAAFPRSRSDRSYRPDPSTTRCDAQGPAITESLSNRRTVISHHHRLRSPLITGCSQRRLCQHAQSGSRAKLIEQRIIIKQIEDHVLLVLFDLLILHVQTLQDRYRAPENVL